MLNIDLISSSVLSASGIKVDVNLERLPDKELIKLRPHGFDLNRGILIETSLIWRTLKSILVFEDYAQSLANYIISRKERIAVFKDIVESFRRNGDKRVINFDIDNSSIIKLTIEESPIDVRTKSSEEYISEQCIDILNAILVFFDLQEEVTEHEGVGIPEGAKVKVEINKYERSRLNRSACINFYGSTCQVCNFNFEKNYGEIGKGFIHVHHTTPVSQLGANYFLNPIKDLIPLCPNCHAMIHQKEPPFTVDELRKIRFQKNVY